MLKRTKRLALAVVSVPVWTWRAIRTIIGLEEILFAGSLFLIGYAFWEVYRPASYGVPGLILLWVTLPPRVPFFVRGERRETTAAKRRG